uniref:Sushi domain-containing protein n=1 Tax=Coturnix japonica TaxID=93934 RepID=A0A8C2TXV2_COTJA
VSFLTLPVVLRCPSPPNITHGQYSREDVKVFVPGTSVRYSCDPGYVLTGKTTVTCLTSGVWSIPYPRCEGQLCPSPPEIDHGQHDGKDVEFIPGMSVNYSCDPGYSLTGKAALYCTDNGSWSSPQPRCEGEMSMLSVPRKGGHHGVPARTKGRGLQQTLTKPGGVKELQNRLLKLDEEMERARLQKYSAFAILWLPVRILISTLSSVSP